MRIEVAIELPAPQRAVWDYASNLERGTEWMLDAVAIRFLTENQTGVGASFECVTKVGPFRTVDKMTVTEWDEPNVIGVSHEGLVTGAGRFTLAPTEAGTRFVWQEQLSLPWRFGGPLLAPLIAPVLRRVWRANLRRFRVRIMERTAEDDKAEPGALVARGRTAELRAWGDRVVRVSLTGRDLSHEAEAISLVREHGFPAPQTFGQPEPSQLVMERLEGPTMLEEMLAKPWLVNGHAKELARLHRRLGEIQAPVGWPRVSTGDSVCHLDMGPVNVKMTTEGPVVIHWDDAARGEPAFDAAATYTILRTSPYAGGVAGRAMVAALRRRFAKAFLAAYGEAEILPHLRAAAELRLLSRDLLATEREALFALARGELE